MERRKTAKLCEECATTRHKFSWTFPQTYFVIDGEEWHWWNITSKEQKCDECGKKSNWIFEKDINKGVEKDYTMEQK